MKKFILIDHSLKDLGGHYYTYASCVLPAAQRAGYQPVLAVHRDFMDFDALPPNWQAHAVFRRKSYSQRTLGSGRRGGPLRRLWATASGAWHVRERERIATSFAADCAELFARVRLEAGDHVFIATASEVDLEGLAIFLESATAAYVDVSWHLQFHLGIFRGRDPDYAWQSADKEAMHAVFQAALQRTQGHRLHLYCTTPQLTAQYQLLQVAPFSTLPYPVHPLFRQPVEHAASGAPARIACLGHSRREKGYRELPLVVRKLWRDYLSKGRAQLVMQTRRRDLRRELDQTVQELGAHSATAPITYAPFPLELERYAELVRSSDVGLLLYDSARYYARCSGVLLEMLGAGVPVIVPGGCWLAEEIWEENQRHLDHVAGHTQALARVTLAQMIWELPRLPSSTQDAASRNVVCFDPAAAFSEIDAPPGAATLLVRFRWLAPTTAGTYIQLDLEQFDPTGSRLSSFAAIAGRRSSDGTVSVLFHLADGAKHLRLAWRNAWDTAEISVTNVECLLLAHHEPAGAVGLTAANMDQSGELLDDVLRHIDHYRHCAAAFATRCAQHHNADQIVALLTAVSSPPEQPIAHAFAERLDAAPQPDV